MHIYYLFVNSKFTLIAGCEVYCNRVGVPALAIEPRPAHKHTCAHAHITMHTDTHTRTRTHIHVHGYTYTHTSFSRNRTVFNFVYLSISMQVCSRISYFIWLPCPARSQSLPELRSIMVAEKDSKNRKHVFGQVWVNKGLQRTAWELLLTRDQTKLKSRSNNYNRVPLSTPEARPHVLHRRWIEESTKFCGGCRLVLPDTACSE